MYLRWLSQADSVKSTDAIVIDHELACWLVEVKHALIVVAWLASILSKGETERALCELIYDVWSNWLVTWAQKVIKVTNDRCDTQLIEQAAVQIDHVVNVHIVNWTGDCWFDNKCEVKRAEIIWIRCRDYHVLEVWVKANDWVARLLLDVEEEPIFVATRAVWLA